MILKTLLNVLGSFIAILINIVNSIMPANNLNDNLGGIITMLLSITQQALNFMYLLFGDTLALVLPTLFILILAKYTIVPIVMLVRSIVINSTN